MKQDRAHPYAVGTIAAILAGAIAAWASTWAVDSLQTKTFDIAGQTAPAASASGKARLYFDSSANRTKISENTGAYRNLTDMTAGSTPISGCGDKRVLFDDAATLGCDADFTWNKTTNSMTFASDTTILGGDGSGAGAGKYIYIQPGTGGATAGIGGIAYYTSGTGGAGGAGGALNIWAGAGGVAGTGGAGGAISVIAGTGAATGGSGGSVSIDGGAKNGAGTVGNVQLATARGQTIVGGFGVEFNESDTNPPCAGGNYTVYSDTSEAKLKKCQNGVLTDLDTSSGITIPWSVASGANLSTSTQEAMPGIYGVALVTSGNELFVQQRAPSNGTVSGATCELATAPGAGKTRQFDFRKSGISTAITPSCADAATTCTDADSVAVTAGDLLTWSSTVTVGTPAASAVTCSLNFSPS